MSLFSIFKKKAKTMTDVLFEWNGSIINFSHWGEDELGVYEYQTRSGLSFRFELVPVANEIRIYILEQPSYGGRASDGHSTHRLGLGDDKPYICIKADLIPTNVPHALTWLVSWAEKTNTYIRTGRIFS